MYTAQRGTGTSGSGSGFDSTTIELVWRKGRVIPGYDANVWRHDACGFVMRRSEYGQTTQYGWEVDHVRPLASGGSDNLANLQPLHWKVNRYKGDSWPTWTCPVAA